MCVWGGGALGDDTKPGGRPWREGWRFDKNLAKGKLGKRPFLKGNRRRGVPKSMARRRGSYAVVFRKGPKRWAKGKSNEGTMGGKTNISFISLHTGGLGKATRTWKREFKRKTRGEGRAKVKTLPKPTGFFVKSRRTSGSFAAGDGFVGGGKTERIRKKKEKKKFHQFRKLKPEKKKEEVR